MKKRHHRGRRQTTYKAAHLAAEAFGCNRGQRHPYAACYECQDEMQPEQIRHSLTAKFGEYNTLIGLMTILGQHDARKDAPGLGNAGR